MSLKKFIEQIYSDDSEYKNPGQGVNQASSLNALSADLYTDSTRFIFELLQNADDSFEQGESIKVYRSSSMRQLWRGNAFQKRPICLWSSK